MTEDLRAARARLGITSGQAARRAGVAAARYRKLEKGRVPSSQYILRQLDSVCRRLDMKSVRVNYVEEFGQYVNIDLSRDARREPLTAFLDVLEAGVDELQDIECFISPAAVFGYLERIGFGATLASRKPADKQMVELLTGAVFTMFLDKGNDYYVKPGKDDPSDVEVLAVERDSRAFSTMKLEIVHAQNRANLYAKRFRVGAGAFCFMGTVECLLDQMSICVLIFLDLHAGNC